MKKTEFEKSIEKVSNNFYSLPEKKRMAYLHSAVRIEAEKLTAKILINMTVMYLDKFLKKKKPEDLAGLVACYWIFTNWWKK